MSGIEPLIMAEAAAGATAATAATTTALTTAAALESATAAYAAAVPGLAAIGPASQAGMLAAQTLPFGAGGLASTAAAGAAPGTLSALGWNAASSLLNPATENVASGAVREVAGQTAGEVLANAGAEKTLEEMACDKVLRQGMDADLPGATMRSIQAGLQNDPFRTLGSLPQYMGMPAPPPGTRELMQGARLISQQPQGGTRTSVSPPMMNRGREVSLAAPVYGLLGGAPMPKRRRLSLI